MSKLLWTRGLRPTGMWPQPSGNQILDHCGIPANPRSAGRVDKAAWHLSLASLIPIVCFSLCVLDDIFPASWGRFAHSRVHDKMTTIEPASRIGRQFQTQFSFGPTVTLCGTQQLQKQKSASLQRPSAGCQVPYRNFSAPPDRQANYFVRQHTTQRSGSAAALFVQSLQVKPPTVWLSTIKSIKTKKKSFSSKVWTELFVFFCQCIN